MTATGTPTHQVNPPSPMAILDLGTTEYSSHHCAMYARRAANSPQNTASRIIDPPTLEPTSGARRTTLRAVRQASTSPEERRVGNAYVVTESVRWSPQH